ncbi:hypothetical protein [Marinobacter sp. tcs-11]|uniref:hypothetical protein n=1 Tax=Marinobacter sp. tcs-11 TaxID=1742860 RepID=UPI0025797E09|nr:hypothetical protein [Marinobacter sp. tcs-11]
MLSSPERLTTQRPDQKPANDAENRSPWVSFKNRPAPKRGERVRVYRNLNNGQYSVRALQGPHKGLVLGYAPAIELTDANLIVREKTRLKAVEQGVRNVHAWSEGIFESCCDHPPASVTTKQLRVTYFPFIKSHFFLRSRPDQTITRIDHAWAYQADIWLSAPPAPQKPIGD